MTRFSLNTAGTSIAASVLFLASVLGTNASLVNVTTENLPDLETVSGYSTPTASDALDQKNAVGSPNATTLYSWLQTQVIVPNPAPINTLQTSGASTTIDFSPYGGAYLVVHWGTGEAGAKFFDPNAAGGFFEAFYIEPGTGNFTLATPTFSGAYYQNASTIKAGTLEIGGLSGWDIFGVTPVPETSTLVAGLLLLLPLGASAIRIIRNK